mmetsp:Transcript_16257/g.26454  ORF Transcript_16257/g.26454 Transcript_16257/m.26454 type:complete len:562 (+) Transcript_16257:85-1770(+)
MKRFMRKAVSVRLTLAATTVVAAMLAVVNFRSLHLIHNDGLARNDSDNQRILEFLSRGSTEIENLAREMVDSFSTVTSPITEDEKMMNALGAGGTNDSPSMGNLPRYVVSSTNPNLDPSEGKRQCICDILAVDCLDSIACIPTANEVRHAQVFLGMEMRRAIKKSVQFEGPAFVWHHHPIGKGLQYMTMDAWNSWRDANQLPEFYPKDERSIFINETWYPDCRDRYNGTSCFFRDLARSEDLTGAVLEQNAKEWFHASYAIRNFVRVNTEGTFTVAIRNRIQTILRNFVHKQRRKLKKRSARLRRHLQHHREILNSPMSPLGHLVLYAHFTRILFNRRPFLDEIYRQHLASIVPSKATNVDASEQDSTPEVGDRKVQLDPFTVSLHMRRGDSCSTDEDHNLIPYEKESSPLDSPAQVSGVRKCYETKVYLDAVERIRKLLPANQPLHVYLSTDDADNVMDEIQTQHSQFYNNVVDEWHFLNYSRSNFQYNFEDFIESPENEKRFILGETAVADLWLLSHGQAFVGHLGSRFGKVGWLLATSRHNAFIPYFTVDGHSEYCVQ